MNEEKQQPKTIEDLLKEYNLSDEDIETFAKDFIEETPKKEEYVDEEGNEIEENVEEILNEETNEETEVKSPASGKKYAGIFDDVAKLEESYKNLQAEYTKLRQKVKPFESFLELLSSNPDFAKFILDKTNDYFVKGTKRKDVEFEEVEEEFEYEEEPLKKGKVAFDEEKLLNLIRNEVNQVLTAQRMLDEFKKAHPDVTDEELVQVINFASKSGLDLETSYMALFREKYKEDLKRQVLSELKGHLSGQRKGQGLTTTPPEVKEIQEKDLWKLALEVARNPQKLKELDPMTRSKLMTILARQIL